MGELKFAKQVPRTVVHSILKDFVEYYVDKEKIAEVWPDVEFFCTEAPMHSYGQDSGYLHAAR